MATTTPTQRTRRSLLEDFIYSFRIFLRNLTRNKVGFIGTLMIVGFIVLAFVVPQFVPK